MTDLSRVLPDFPTGEHGTVVAGLEKHGVTTSDLLTLDAAELGRRAKVPLLDVRRLCDAVLRALHADLGVAALGTGGGGREGEAASRERTVEEEEEEEEEASTRRRITKQHQQQPPSPSSTATAASGLRSTPAQLAARWSTISTLDPVLDEALGGGLPAGYVTEITGESGAGKTQLLLSLLLAVQLPPPHGLGRPAIYISTEAALSTRRLAQLLASSQLLQRHRTASSSSAGGGGGSSRTSPRPSLDSVFSIATTDLETQDHILSFQVPVMASRLNVGLVVLDSVAANFRAEFERGGASSSSSSSNNMGARTAELVRLGMLLRELARVHNLAVVVANQVADRFEPKSPPRFAPQTSPAHFSLGRSTQESPLAARSRRAGATAPVIAEPPSSSSVPEHLSMPPPSSNHLFHHPRNQQAHHDIPALLLDHQQRWFTGWGDEEQNGHGLHSGEHKTPSLGLVWTTQIAARVALLKSPTYGRHRVRTNGGGGGDDDDDDDDHGDEKQDEEDGQRFVPTTWRRWMKVVFAPHVPPSGPGLDGATEFEITSGGLRGLLPSKRRKKG